MPKTEQELIVEAAEAERTRRQAEDSDDSSSKRKRRPKTANGEDSAPKRPRKEKIIDLAQTPRQSIVIKKPEYPCILCPSLSTKGLQPVFEPPDAIRKTCTAADGKVMAHHECALSVPEIGVEDILVDGEMKVCVTNVQDVPKDRWNLVSRLIFPRCF